ncbi:MAG: pseudaminic acid biosynthesis-associated methylase [Magnetococcales bacterium]|nr:pseudaminic acid biosynthesis-associated methylase [Magnetococcales bacterium]
MSDQQAVDYKTEQEHFWAGHFGDEYTERNHPQEGQLLTSKTAVFTRIARAAGCRWSTILELGANRGLNLHALRRILPEAQLSAVEINPTAVSYLREVTQDVHIGSILEFVPQKQYELVFTMGVLIHIHPQSLPQVYEKLAHSSANFVCVCEYYNPSPVEVTYRGHSGKLFKRDFAGEFMAQFPEFHLVDYGFVYHKDPVFPLDDFTWFLMQRQP